jgi:hypothetical protein
MNDPIINVENTLQDNEDVIIERHEDGSECRKCKNCACVNNKLANVGIEVSTIDAIKNQQNTLDSKANAYKD